MFTSRLGARAGLVQVSLAGLLWGTTGVVVQLIRQDTTLSPTSIGFYRLAVAALGLLLLQARQLSSVIAAVRASPVTLLLVGIGLGAYQASYFIAVAAIGVSLATMISLGLAPVCVAVWESAAARRPPSRLTIGSLAGGVLGLVLITVAGGHTTTGPQHPLLGLLAAVASGVGYAATTVLSRHAAQRTPAMTLTTISTVVGGIALLPFAVVSGLGFHPVLHPRCGCSTSAWWRTALSLPSSTAGCAPPRAAWPRCSRCSSR